MSNKRPHADVRVSTKFLSIRLCDLDDNEIEHLLDYGIRIEDTYLRQVLADEQQWRKANELWFTDDAGTDFQLSTGSAGEEKENEESHYE